MSMWFGGFGVAVGVSCVLVCLVCVSFGSMWEFGVCGVEVDAWMEGYLILVDIVRPFSFFIDRGYKNR